MRSTGRTARRRSGSGAGFDSLSSRRTLLLMFVPAIVYFTLFAYLPIPGISIAFKDYKLARGILGSSWVGLQNFRELFGDRTFYLVLRNTVVISAYRYVVGLAMPIAFALLLNEIRRSPFKRTVQTVSYLPHFVSWVVLAGIFNQLLSPGSGVVNVIIKGLGLQPVYFLADPRWFRFTLIATAQWKNMGWSSIIYLAALASVDVEMYEAAVIDGARRRHKIRYIQLVG